MRIRGLRACAVGLAALAVVLLPACSGGDDSSSDTTRPPRSTTTIPPECEGVEPGSDDLPDACADAVYVNVLMEDGSDEVQELSKEQLIGFGRGMCAYARAIGETPDATPLYSDLVASNATSWEVSKQAVEEIITNAAQLCPKDMETVLELRQETGKIRVELAVNGKGPIDVTYTGPEGGSLQDRVSAPWEHAVTLQGPTDFHLSATGEEGEELTCVVTIKGEEIARATSTDGEAAVCEATGAEVNVAGR